MNSKIGLAIAAVLFIASFIRCFYIAYQNDAVLDAIILLMIVCAVFAYTIIVIRFMVTYEIQGILGEFPESEIGVKLEEASVIVSIKSKKCKTGIITPPYDQAILTQLKILGRVHASRKEMT